MSSGCGPSRVAPVRRSPIKAVTHVVQLCGQAGGDFGGLLGHGLLQQGIDGLVAATTARWRERGYDATVVPLTPIDDAAAADAAGRHLAALAPDLVVFDCISYNRGHRARVMAHVDAPALVAVDVMAHFIAALHA